jgi:CheY-like chemotaxis protein
MGMGIKVLYVDDEPNLLEIARLFLERTGDFQVSTATSAKDALDSSSIRSYDLIVSDYQMPGMDGIAFLKEVRKRYGDIPFILFTGRGREEVVIEAINNGVDYYLQKGGNPETQFAELAHNIHKAVARKKAEDATLAISTELQMIFRNMINAFVVFESVFDVTGKYVSFRFGYFNDAYARIAKLNYAEVRGKEVFEIWPATEAGWVEVYGRVATTGIPETFDMYHGPTQGWYHCNAYRPTESPDKICVIFEKITGRKTGGGATERE